MSHQQKSNKQKKHEEMMIDSVTDTASNRRSSVLTTFGCVQICRYIYEKQTHVTKVIQSPKLASFLWPYIHFFASNLSSKSYFNNIFLDEKEENCVPLPQQKHKVAVPKVCLMTKYKPVMLLSCFFGKIHYKVSFTVFQQLKLT